MNREIKFRVWLSADKDMAYSDQYGDIALFFRDIVPLTDKDELMQLTGLLDKNGKEVYEGDKLKDSELFDDYAYFVITWDNELARFQIDGYGYAISFGEGSQEVYDEEISCIDKNVFAIDCISEFEVIGNIYENPELLKP